MVGYTSPFGWCMTCGSENNGTIRLDGMPVAPTGGSVSVCGLCGAVQIFTGNGPEQRRPTFSEWPALAADVVVVATQAAIREGRADSVS